MNVPPELESDIIVFLRKLFNGDLKNLKEFKAQLVSLTMKAIILDIDRENLEKQKRPWIRRYRRYFRDVRTR